MIEFDSGVGLFDDASGLFDDGGVVNATVTLSGIALSATFGSVSAVGSTNSTATVSGVTSNITTGEVIALGTGSAIATVTGAQAQTTAGSVTASAATVSTRKGRKSNAKFLPFTARPVTLQTDGRAKIATQTLTSGVAEVTAAGTTSGRANVRGLQLKTVCRVPTVDAIINPTDDELIWLLAA